MLERVNRIVLAFAAVLLLAGAGAAVGVRVWEAETVVQVGRLARAWRLLIVALCAVPLLSWPAAAAVGLLRRRRLVRGGLIGFAWLVVTVNLLFWGLVEARFEPVERLFEKGRVVWVGQRAFLFGHGYWKLTDGYWQHQTVVRLPDGRLYDGATLDLLVLLRQRGASTVWGSWCYTGNYPYIRKDLISGRRVPWPSYASYNTSPGLTIPIWLGSTFFRLGWPRDRYVAEPATLGPVAPDTLLLMNPSASRIEQAFSLMQQRIPGLPRPDSVSWQPVAPDTVHSMSWLTLASLSREERSETRRHELAMLRAKTRMGLALYWVRGRAFPVYVQVPARLHRGPEPPQYAHEKARPGRLVPPG